ncbi:ACP S-malonyltransferase [Kitasatospora sp. NBC_00240]|uniref:ACP S-malonyltransferase n=1 Tax=Kitasatospora sp. NBC_00240 TaxID=2903567 RepID=UPI002255C0C8|nr:ACP S-malonyltransferase [Kitasatospora sp. NBC_00240]MCX5214359.1 ACP S-malonyltransferase [Kitasatospora sp. NBC_00240]
MRTYVFPGQGSQRKGMGGALFDEFEDLTRAADSILGYSVKALCLEDPEGLLKQTEYTQPALYVVNALSYYRKLRETGQLPDFVAGHSLGEFNALLAAECFDFETGLRLVQKRGELMAQATGGAMAAVLNATDKEIRTVLEQNGLTSVDLANYNTPSQIVISGLAEDIKAAQAHFQSGNHLFVALNTSGAFHSRYMEPARAEFAAFIAGIPFSELRIPVISNVTGRPYENESVKDNLARQIVSSVRWTDTVEHLLGHEGMEIEEIGHGDVLTKLVRKIRREIPNPARHSAPAPVKPLPAAVKPRPAADLVRQWNAVHPVGTLVKSTTGDYGDLRTATEATVLFGHRPAVYMDGYRGYFDLTEIEPVH